MEELVLPYLTILADFRHEVRGVARSLKATDILSECDRLRDEVLPAVGVRLEDIEGQLLPLLVLLQKVYKVSLRFNFFIISLFKSL